MNKQREDGHLFKPSSIMRDQDMEMCSGHGGGHGRNQSLVDVLTLHDRRSDVAVFSIIPGSKLCISRSFTMAVTHYRSTVWVNNVDEEC